jgi:hypothetical protein
MISVAGSGVMLTLQPLLHQDSPPPLGQNLFFVPVRMLVPDAARGPGRRPVKQLFAIGQLLLRRFLARSPHTVVEDGIGQWRELISVHE